jgi:RHS repeat-associated protein
LSKLVFTNVSATAAGQTPQYRESSFEYEPTYPWRLSKEVIEPNRSALTLTTAYGYDGFGNRTTKTLSGPDITTRTVETLTYDALGQFITSRKNALNHTESFTYDARTGAVATATDANNITTTNSYDGLGRRFQTSRPGSPTTNIYYLCWDGSIPASGVKCPTTTGKAITAVRTVTAGSGENYIYGDMLGRTVQTNTQGFGGNWVYQQTSYDNLGRTISATHPYLSGETPHYTYYSYYPDALGRLWKVTEAGTVSRVTSMTYGALAAVGKTTTSTNPLNQTKTVVTNAHNQIASVTDNAGTTTYTYDPFGNLTQVSKSYDINATITMGYDIRGHKISMNDPDMGAWTYGYDVLGQLRWQKDAKLQTTNMTYDLLGRMATRVLPNGEGTSTWTYDTAAYGKGKFSSISSPNVTESYVYDSLSRPTTVINNRSGALYITKYTYDTYSRPLTLTYPSGGFAVRHCYDSVGYLVRVENATNSTACSSTLPAFWTATAFDAHNRLTKESFGNGLISARAYDHDTGDLQYIKTGTTANPTSIQNSTYGFDVLDNLTARSWSNGTTIFSESFGYDTLNRLTSVAGPAAKAYWYDAAGNITLKSGVGSYTYPTNGVHPHAVSSTLFGTTTTNYTYDANGNMTTRAGNTITYTAFNKPKTIAGASGTTTLTYDANFNRISKVSASGTTSYVGKLYEKQVIGTFVTQSNYIYAGNNLVGVYITSSDGLTNTRYFHTDYLGSVEVITGASGSVLQRLSYDAFGKRRNVNGTDATIITSLTTRGYTRHEQDDEVGLVNMNAREYDPLLGRFITADTVIPGMTNSQAFNRYSYVNNSPLSFTDPSGNWSLRRSVTRVLNRVNEIRYVGGLLGIALITGTQFGYVYGAATGDWQTVYRAHATGAVIAAGVWVQPTITALPWSSNIGASMALGYTSGYTTARINGASSSEARAAGMGGARFAGVITVLNLAAEEMREYAVDTSQNPAPDGTSPNATGVSAGARGDGVKVAGTRCVAGGGPCVPGLLGGSQGGDRTIFGVPYAPDGVVNYTLESFAGSHDFFNSFMYTSDGFLRPLYASGVMGAVGETASWLNVLTATPFATAYALQPWLPYLNPLDLEPQFGNGAINN